MFKRGIKRAYLSQTSKQYESNYEFIKGFSMNTLYYRTPNFTLIYNGGDKMVVKARLGKFTWIANARPFMKNRYEKFLKEFV